MKSVILLLLVVGCASADPRWETLKVTWGIPGRDPNAFAPMPLTAKEAEKEGFVLISNRCLGETLGNKYMKGSDSAVVLLYDIKGHIAGIQTALPKRLVNKVNTDYPFASTPMYRTAIIKKEEHFILTAYFVDPSIICKGGRSLSEVAEQGTGNQLAFQNGSNPLTDLVKVPMYETQLGETKNDWKKGQCFMFMGMHYWYNMRTDMDCKELVPFFLLYNHGKLTGFGFASVGKYDFTTRYEYPPKEVFAKIIVPVPDCLPVIFDRAGGYSTMHVYFNNRPENFEC